MDFKKYKWHREQYTEDEILTVPARRMLERYLRKWGYSGSMDDYKKQLNNALILMKEQVSKRMYYDFNSHVDFDGNVYCVVQIPMVGFKDEMSAGMRFVLTKGGMRKAEPDDDKSMSLDELHSYVANLLTEYINVALLYSAGGIADMATL